MLRTSMIAAASVLALNASGAMAQDKNSNWVDRNTSWATQYLPGGAPTDGSNPQPRYTAQQTMQMQAIIKPDMPHQAQQLPSGVHITDEYGFKYDARGNRLK
jgi:pSer/pThr/pTyr-binding forkhead associated (FHA) protein